MDEATSGVLHYVLFRQTACLDRNDMAESDHYRYAPASRLHEIKPVLVRPDGKEGRALQTPARHGLCTTEADDIVEGPAVAVPFGGPEMQAEPARNLAMIVLPSSDLATTAERGGLLAETFPRFLQHRDALLRLVARTPDVTSFLATVAGNLGGKTAAQFKVVLPPGALEAIERGDWHWIHAKDGSGFLPTLADADNKFIKQVRIRPEDLRGLDPAAIANAAAHAQTHALLREIIAKLDVIERNVDLVLACQVAGWRGQIAAGIEQLKVVLADPGEREMRSGVLANAFQSLAEGQKTGMFVLKEYLKSELQPVAPGWRQFLPFGNPKWESPSAFHASVIDRAQEDFSWFYAASVAKARVHAASGRAKAARTELLDLEDQFRDVALDCRKRFEHATYAEERRQFWEEQVSNLLSLPARSNLPVGIQCSPAELMQLCEVKGEGDHG